MGVTVEEKHLLEKLNSGALDGVVGSERIFGTYKQVYCGKFIKEGEPISYREGQTTRLFNNKECEHISGKRKEEHFDTEERKLEFLQRFGFLIDDKEVKAYSAKYKPNK